MKLSIISATFNSEKTIVKTLNSVLSQNGVNELFELEHIIIDGASTDSTISIVEDFREKYNTRGVELIVKSENDSGIYDAWNKGLKLSSGDWISFLGSDDTYLNHALENYANLALLNEDADLIHSKVKIFKESSFIREINKKWNWKQFKKNMNVAHAGAFHNKNYFKKYGNFNDGYEIAGDYDMLLRARSELKTIFLEEFTVIMQEGGISSKMFLKSFKEAERAKMKTAGISLINAKKYSLYSLFRYYGGKVLRKLGLK